MINVNWNKDYHDDFICPKCSKGHLLLQGWYRHKIRTFKCSICKKQTVNSCILRGKHLNFRLEAYGLGCPRDTCNAREMITQGVENGKKIFKCNICQARALAFCELTKTNLSKYAYKKSPVKPFSFQDNEWDLRSINTSSCEERSRYIVNFKGFKCDWFRLLSKQYIYLLFSTK